jgi:Ca-activated chloride channel family protein
MMRFAQPLLLLLLLLLPVLYFIRRRQPPATLAYSSLHDLAAVPPSVMARLRRLLFPGLRLLGLLLVIVALARPQQGLEAIEVSTQGIAIVMVVDISGSMAALDLQLDGQQANRLQVVKHSFRTFVEGNGALSGRDHDLIGMVTFARYADAICPLTLDHRTLLDLLEQVQIVTQPEEDGTAIGEAIALGVDRLRSSPATSRVMIVLTDGTNNAGETTPLQAAEIAKALGIKIYTIGTGTRGTALVPVRTRSGQTVMQRTYVSIDEETLTRIAETTGGRYFRATDSQALQAIYGEIDRLEKTTTVAQQFQQYAERFPLLLLPGLGLLVLEVVLSSTRFRTVP